MNKTLNFLRILNSLASLGLMGYVGYKYAKQCGDIDRLIESAKERVMRRSCSCHNRMSLDDLDSCCNCEPEPLENSVE